VCTIGEMSPSLPLGVKFSAIKISHHSGKSFSLDKVGANVSLMKIIIGQLGGSIVVELGKKGEVVGDVGISIGDLMNGQLLPKKLLLSIKDFKIDEISAFLFQYLASQPDANPLVAPELKKLVFKGTLNSLIDIKLDAKNPLQSMGDLSLNLRDSSFSMDDGYIPEQSFKKADIKAKMNSGRFQVEKGSGLESQDLRFEVSGDIGLKNPINRSLLNLNMLIGMRGAIKEKFGILLEMQFLGGERMQNELVLQVTGPLDMPSIRPAGT